MINYKFKSFYIMLYSPYLDYSKLFLYSFPSILNIKYESFNQTVFLASVHTIFKHFFSNFNVKSGRIDLISSFVK
jgi:hypothetical protein